MPAYHEVMAEESTATQLVDEAPDMTATELHVLVVHRLFVALSYALKDRAGVFSDIFLRVDDREQVAADVFVVPGVARGRRRVYAVPREPVPSVTVEVLSTVNRTSRGRAEFEAKRSLFARIGVPLHLEIDPDDGYIAVWELSDGAFVRAELSTVFTSDAIGGVRLETPAPGELHILLPDGHEVLDGDEELARAERLAVKAERLAAKLRELGVDPER